MAAAAQDGSWRQSMALGDRLYRAGRIEAAEAAYREGVSAAGKAGAPIREQAAAISALAVTQQDGGKCADARASYWRALQLWDSLGAAAVQQSAATTTSLVNLYVECGDARGAEQLLRARRAQLDRAASDPLQAASVLSARASIEHLHHREKKAADLFLRSYEILNSRLGPGNYRTAVAATSVSTLQLALGRARESVDFAMRAVAALEKLQPGSAPLAKALNNLGCAYAGMHRYEEAATALHRAAGMAEARLGPAHPITASILRNESFVLEQAHRKPDAAAAARAASEPSPSSVRDAWRQTVNAYELATVGVK